MNEKTVEMISHEKIEARIAELGKKISEDYKGKNLKIIGVLKGCIPFMCTLMQHIDNPGLTIDFMSVSSYGSGTTSSGRVRILKDLDKNIEGEDVLIAEDVVDTGFTLSKLVAMLAIRNPKSLKVCTLLDKPSRREVEFNADYVGFEIEDKFVVGYGLDYDQRYRQLPYIAEVIL